MQAILIILLILVAVVLFAIFGPSKPQPKSEPSQAQPTTAAQPGVQPGVQPGMRPGAQPGAPAAAGAPAGQRQGLQAARERGDFSTPVAATGITTETVDVGGGGAVFEAKRRMTDKLDQVSPSGRKR